jgi:hypothetical protein
MKPDARALVGKTSDAKICIAVGASTDMFGSAVAFRCVRDPVAFG